MSSSLKIRNLNEKRSDASPIPHEFMPQPPFRMIVCGASHSGKSNMIKNMITVPEYRGWRTVLAREADGASKEGRRVCVENERG